ncbi:helix-hairpin-helix domain-containing protein [Halanaerobacter jeridensis]|uniref:Competence ComEA-like helix-hairpin-helix protein n=1 Tax=Halanaerobacter jeridensis TaxID=706427 RepID=A0A938XUA6_9FIRM|nr:helix-hairpin-helix domain-containing protein [Halanaerobacter jeridensis]MBM7556451.1 competence ComEA-like helix-hairpin-helix protein [Halanaerobacter jeridensis]
MKDLNSVDIKELQQIKGIGKVTAQNIVQYREENGGFDSLDELKNVSGVGAKSFANLKEEITLGETSDNDENNISVEEAEEDLVRIEFNPADYEIAEVNEVHLVGDMNNWDPSDKTYSLEPEESGIWANSFALEEGLEYKVMYDSTSWEEDKHVGFYGDNLKVGQ